MYFFAITKHDNNTFNWLGRGPRPTTMYDHSKNNFIDIDVNEPNACCNVNLRSQKNFIRHKLSFPSILDFSFQTLKKGKELQI